MDSGWEVTLTVPEAPALDLGADPVASLALGAEPDPEVTLGVGTVVGSSRYSRVPNDSGGDTVSIG